MECSKCKLSKEKKLFPKSGKICNDCRKEYSRQYRLNNPEKVRIYQKLRSKWMWENRKEYLQKSHRKHWQKNKEKYMVKHKEWYLSKSDEYKEKYKNNQRTYSKAIAIKVKLEVMSAYSNGTPKCACCGEKNIGFLTIDHIKNNGTEERKKLKRAGFAFYLYLKKQGFPQNGYQVLCFNCNCAKRTHNGICPHMINLNK